MKPKKKPRVDLNRRSILFFQVGLIIVLFLSWQVIEYKAYAEADGKKNGNVFAATALEDEPIVIINFTETPPPKVLPQVIDDIEIVKNEDEGQTEPVELVSRTEPVKIEDITEIIPKEPIKEYSIMAIESVPVFPGCENLMTNQEKTNCMSKKIREFVGEEFDTNLGSEIGEEGMNKIYVTFKINEKGEVVETKSRGPHPKMEEEAERVVNMLPKMIPGKQQGEPVKVLYSLPIIFEVRK